MGAGVLVVVISCLLSSARVFFPAFSIPVHGKSDNPFHSTLHSGAQSLYGNGNFRDPKATSRGLFPRNVRFRDFSISSSPLPFPHHPTSCRVNHTTTTSLTASKVGIYRSLRAHRTIFDSFNWLWCHFVPLSGYLIVVCVRHR